MKLFIWILIFISVFCFMEFMAWFTHQYIMHGFLWNLHRDHHNKAHGSWSERIAAFFVFYAIISLVLCWLRAHTDFWQGWPVGFGILASGIAYFTVHDIFIHQRFKWLRSTNNRYAKALRRAHKIHHKHLGKSGGECYGMLFVPFKYFK